MSPAHLATSNSFTRWVGVPWHTAYHWLRRKCFRDRMAERRQQSAYYVRVSSDNLGQAQTAGSPACVKSPMAGHDKSVSE